MLQNSSYHSVRQQSENQSSLKTQPVELETWEPGGTPVIRSLQFVSIDLVKTMR